MQRDLDHCSRKGGVWHQDGGCTEDSENTEKGPREDWVGQGRLFGGGVPKLGSRKKELASLSSFKARGSWTHGGLRGLENGVLGGLGVRDDCRDETGQEVWGYI